MILNPFGRESNDSPEAARCETAYCGAESKKEGTSMELSATYIDDDCELDESCELGDFDCGKSSIECICPKCGIRHKMKLCWTGSGVPRKFCNACRKSALSYDFDEFYSLNTAYNS